MPPAVVTRPASSDVVCVMDADAYFDPGDLPSVADPVLTGDADLMLGRRSVQGKGAWPLHARIGNRVLAAELRRRIGVPVRDLGPMRAARREAIGLRTRFHRQKIASKVAKAPPSPML